MWFLFTIFLLLWILSIHYYLPVWAIFMLFTAMIYSAAFALSFPNRSSSDPSTN